MSDWTGARLRTNLANDIKAQADAAGESFQNHLQLIVERGLRESDLNSGRPVITPIGRTKEASLEFKELAADRTQDTAIVYADHTGRMWVVAGHITAVHSSWLQVRPQGSPGLAIGLDQIVAWSGYRNDSTSPLYEIVTPWLRQGAHIHPWTPMARELVAVAHQI